MTAMTYSRWTPAARALKQKLAEQREQRRLQLRAERLEFIREATRCAWAYTALVFIVGGWFYLLVDRVMEGCR